MALSRRYAPSWPPEQSSQVGIDLSPILPPGVSLESAALEIVVNRNPVQPTTDWAQDDVVWRGRQAWCRIAGGQAGIDYQCRWTLTDSRGNTWRRTALLLCAESG